MNPKLLPQSYSHHIDGFHHYSHPIIFNVRAPCLTTNLISQKSMFIQSLHSVINPSLDLRRSKVLARMAHSVDARIFWAFKQHNTKFKSYPHWLTANMQWNKARIKNWWTQKTTITTLIVQQHWQFITNWNMQAENWKRKGKKVPI